MPKTQKEVEEYITNLETQRASLVRQVRDDEYKYYEENKLYPSPMFLRISRNKHCRYALWIRAMLSMDGALSKLYKLRSKQKEEDK